MQRKLIVLHLVTNTAYAQQILRGISQVAMTETAWSFAVESWVETEPIESMPCDGIIFRLDGHAMPTAWPKGVPAVNISSTPIPGMIQVCPDNALAGRLAAEHLIARGFRHFAFRGDDRIVPSRERRDGFRRRIEEGGFNFYDLNPGPDLSRKWTWRAELDETARLIRELPKPLGLMTFNGLVGRRVLEACRLADIRVPDDLSVISGEDDEYVCGLSRPQLSGVDLGPERLGHEAAQVLARLMRGEPAPAQAIRIQPLRVVARRSTDVLAVGDPEVLAAMRYIQAHACDGIGVSEVVQQVPLSRRALEMRFRTALGRAPGQEIRRAQIERARQLLAETDLPMPTIAAQCGFRDAARFATAFRQRTGSTPTKYRRTVAHRA